MFTTRSATSRFQRKCWLPSWSFHPAWA